MILKKKQTEKYEELRGLMGNGKDYHVYRMMKKDYLIAGFLGFVIAAIVLFAFF